MHKSLAIFTSNISLRKYTTFEYNYYLSYATASYKLIQKVHDRIAVRQRYLKYKWMTSL